MINTPLFLIENSVASIALAILLSKCTLPNYCHINDLIELYAQKNPETTANAKSYLKILSDENHDISVILENLETDKKYELEKKEYAREEAMFTYESNIPLPIFDPCHLYQETLGDANPICIKPFYITDASLEKPIKTHEIETKRFWIRPVYLPKVYEKEAFNNLPEEIKKIFYMLCTAYPYHKDDASKQNAFIEKLISSSERVRLYTNKSKVRISIFLKIGCFYIFYCKFYSPAESFTFFS